MAKIGAAFPEILRREIAISQLKVGAVLSYRVDFTTPPKSKRLIVVGFDDSKVYLACSLINTEINPKVFPTKELRDLHLPLGLIGNEEILAHDSFVDCSKIFEQSIESVLELMTETTETLLGEISTTDIASILEKIKLSPTISVSEKRRFGLL